MRKLDYSIRTILGLIIGFMGVLALLLALASGEVHQRHAYNNQRQSMQKLIRLKADDLLNELAHKSTDLGASLQIGKGFHDAFTGRDQTRMRAIMHNQFHDYFVTAGVLKLDALVALGPDFSTLAEFHEDKSEFATLDTDCPALFQHAKDRKGPARIKLLSGICVDRGRPHHLLLLPIGGLRLTGYLAVVTDPTYNLRRIESALGMPLTIRLPSGALIYQSASWPKQEEMANAILADYELKSGDSQSALSLVMADDVRPLYGYLPQTRMLVMIAASLITLVGILVAMLVLRGTTLKPLQALTDHLHKVRGDRKLFGQKIAVGGTRELQDLGNSFNEMTEELVKLYKSLEVMAFTDQLTELPNRNRFQERMQGFMQIHQTLQKPFALLIMDLDRFKNINETLGHNVGDQLLKAVGMRLEQALRGSDLVAYLDKSQIQQWGNDAVARLGGDEFSAILPGVGTMENAEIAAQKVIKAMTRPFVINEHELLVSLSIGIVLYPLHGVDRHDLMSKADVAMYQAKKNRQGYVMYDSSFNKNSLRHLMLERDLHTAILKDQLVLYYQPKINLATGQTCGTEALVRWKHPELGMVPPDEFISLAEQSGQIQQLSAWVLYRAVKDCSAWRAQGYDVSVSINLSAVNLRDRELFEEISTVLERWSFDPAHLILELTESAVMSDPAFAMQILKRLREMGLGLSIDDFGTGYSSLAYLKQLPVTEIKVDRSFVRDLANDVGDQAIIRAVVALAQDRQLSVVAEGVEDLATYNLLKELNCGMTQGYYVARPMPVQDYFKWLEASEWRPLRASNA